MLSFDFIIRALTVGILVSLCASLLGTSLVLKRYSMIGDGLSHVGYGALAVAAALNLAPLNVAIPVVIIAAFFLLRLSQNSKLKGDALIAIISCSALSVGMIVVSVFEVNIDVNSYMFGSILALQTEDVILSVVSSLTVIVLYVLFYNKIFAVTFDESFSKATGITTGLYNGLIAVLTAVVIVVGMRLMGALLISGLIIFPSLSAMRICKSYRGVTLFSVAISVSCFIIGLFVTFYLPVPTGACIVVTNLAAFMICTLIGKIIASVSVKL
ncbi:MAG: metal ABC transporter permease [Firmicutes bacterium]|nr:metal ABC transporter permease [[Eubacterium] siraeum]MCM1487399.1 metal ABC transporter permease [Bacillota bacterium]